METAASPGKDTATPLDNPPQPPETVSVPVTPAGNSENPPADSKESTIPPVSRPSESPSPAVEVVTVPSYGRWFSFNKFHETEIRAFSEFFDGKSASKNPNAYKYLRDFMVKKYRENPSRKVTFTEIRRNLVGDVGTIRRVFDFLESWSLINYTATKHHLKWEERDKSQGNPVDSSSKSQNNAVDAKEVSKKVCSSCKMVCSNVCFACQKVDAILCARCFVRGNYRVGLSSVDFKRVDLIGETKADWTDRETLHLLEAILQYNDDWKKVAEHVGSRTEKECIARFIKLPFGEQFIASQDLGEVDKYYLTKDHSETSETEPEKFSSSSPTKRRRLTPLADASNPIMAQVAFLAAMVGTEVAEAAARAAVAALSEVGPTNSERIGSPAQEKKQQNPENDQGVAEALEEVAIEARAQLDQEEQDVEQSISNIIEVQMKEIQDKIIHFEEMELIMEKERVQLEYMKNQLFADQLNFLQQKSKSIFGEGKENTVTADDVT